MTYASEILKESVASNYLVVIVPRRKLSSGGWIISGSNVYQPFTLGDIKKFELDGSELTEASSVADIGTGGDWFYDVDEQRIYCDSSLNPNNFTSVVFYQIYLSTFDAYWYSDPLDTSTRTVYYEPLVTTSPEIISSSTDDLFGFLPTFSSRLQISNATSFLTEHVYASSFNLCEIKIYHYLSELTVANTKLVLDGFTSNVNYSDRSIAIEVFDNNAIFNREFRQPGGRQFFATSWAPNVDPTFIGRPVRKVFGRVDNFIPVAIDFDDNAPSTTNNRDYVVMDLRDNIISIFPEVPASPTSTATRTYLDSVEGLNVGDNVWIDKAAGVNEYKVITAVVETTAPAGYIEHSAMATGAASAGDNVRRGFIGQVWIYRSGFSPLQLNYIEDYTILTGSPTDVAGFRLVDNFESSYSGAGEMFEAIAGNPTTLVTSDLIYCRVYGPYATASDTISGVAGSTSVPLSNSLEIIHTLLKNYLAIDANKIDTTSLAALLAAGKGSEDLGFAIPAENGSDFPSYKDIFIEIAESVLVKFFVNDDIKYSIAATSSLNSTPDKTIEDDEILARTFEYSFDYKDIISDVKVGYNRKEVSTKFQQVLTSDVVSASSDDAKFLHKVESQKTFNSILSEQSAAQTLADRIATILGERRGRIFFSTKNRFFDTIINDTHQVSRDRLPGFAFVDGTNRNVSGSVQSVRRSLTKVDIELDDQKGIQDNPSEWT